MATYYWVGGAGTWNASSTTNWASSSGGTGGAGVPLASDDVVFDTSSGTGTVTVTSNSGSCKDFTVTASQALTFSGTLGNASSANTVGCSGNIALPSGGSAVFTALQISLIGTATTTITTNGKTLNSLYASKGVGGVCNLADNLVLSNDIRFYNSVTFNTNNYNINCANTNTNVSSAQTVNLGSSTWTITGTGIQFDSIANFNAGTSTITLSSSSGLSIVIGGKTFYNVSFTGGGTNLIDLTGTGGTFNNLSVTANAAGTKLFRFAANQTINGTLSTSGTTTTNRIQFQSNTAGVQRTLSIANAPSVTNSNFKDIALTGAASPWAAPVDVWDLGNNSGITFNNGPLYWVGGAGTWNQTSTTNWALTSGGSGGAGVPGPNTDIVIDTSSGTGSITLGSSSAPSQCRNLTVTATQAIALGNEYIYIYGNLTFPPTGSFSVGAVGAAGGFYFLATTSVDITPNGKNLGYYVYFSGSGTFNLQSNWTTSNNQFVTINKGTFNTNNYTLGGWSSGYINISGATTVINLGSSTVNINSWGFSVGAGVTLNAGTSTITGSGGISTSGGFTFYNASVLGVSGSNTFNNLTMNGGGLISGNQTVTGTFTASGASVSSRVTITNPTTTSVTITAAAVVLNNVNFYKITGAGAASWSGTSVGDWGGNSGITFTSPKTVYMVSTGSPSWSTANIWATSSGGVGATANFPLAQDTVYIDNNSAANGGSIGLSGAIPAGIISFANRTNPVSVIMDYIGPGSLTLSSAVTSVSASTGNTEYYGNASIDMAGKSTSSYISTNNNYIYSLKLLSDFTTTNAQYSWYSSPVTGGSNFDLNGYNFIGSGEFLWFNAQNTLSGPGKIITSAPYIQWATIRISGLTNTPTTRATLESTYSGTSARSFTIGGTEANIPNLLISNGGGTVYVPNTYDLDFTGFSGTLANNSRNVYGSLTISSGMTLTAGTGTTTFAATSGTKTITTNGKTLDFPITFNGVGGTWQLADNLTVGSRTTTLTNGTLDLNGKTYLSGGQFATAAGTKNITFNGGTLNCANSGLAFYNIQPTGFTTTQGSSPGKITFTSASAKTFTGGGSTYNCTIEQAGAGALTIQGSNTFTTISNSVQPTTFTFTSGTTQTVTNFNVSGTSGNLVTINASSTTNAILSKSSGIVDVSYCSISRSTATGGAEWRAYTSNGNVDGGNNSGWLFSPLAGSLFFGSNF